MGIENSYLPILAGISVAIVYRLLLFPYNKKEIITAVTAIIVASFGSTLVGVDINMVFYFLISFSITFVILYFIKKKGTGEPGVAFIRW